MITLSNSKLIKSYDFKDRNTAIKLLKESSNNLFGMQTELVAYLNRLGQFYYFTKSTFVTNINKTALSLIPRIDELKIFRMKNTAHRSLDAPRDESYILQLYQANS